MLFMTPSSTTTDANKIPNISSTNYLPSSYGLHPPPSHSTSTSTAPHCRRPPPLSIPSSLPRSRTVGDGPLYHISPSTSFPPQSTSASDVARHLSGLHTDHEFVATPLDDVWSVANKRRGVYNLIQVPLRLERLLFFTQAICLHDFLTLFTFLPFRFLLSLMYLFFYSITYPLRLITRHFFRLFNAPKRSKLSSNKINTNSNTKSKTKSNTNSAHRNTTNLPNDDDHSQQQWTQRLVSCAIDFQHISLLVLTVCVLRLFDTSRIYHSIRGQSAIKLYVVFNAIEIFDRLCSSFGVDMLDSLGWTTASAVSFLSRSTRHYSSNLNVNRTSTSNPSPAPNSSASAVQAMVLLTRMTFDYIFALAYVMIHATLLLTWVVTLNVCINTQNNALLTLLVSNNFVELKGHAFKSFKVPNVFQIACADAVERFQLTTFLLLMLADGHHPSLLLTWGVIYLCEIAVDWIKHAFMLKFNRIPHRVYRIYGLVISQVIVRSRRHAVVRSVGGSPVSKRVGFVTLPLAALVIRIVTAPVARLPIHALPLLWLILVVVKCALGICITGHAWRRVCHGFDDGTNEERERDEYWVQKLLPVERYDLISKA